jgi:hypothetical protein
MPAKSALPSFLPQGGKRRSGLSALQATTMPSVKGRFGSKVRAHSALESGLDTRDKATLAAVALLHLKRTAAIRAVEDHLIERVNGGYGYHAASPSWA